MIKYYGLGIIGGANMRKYLLLLLVVLPLFIFAGCGQQEASSKNLQKPIEGTVELKHLHDLRTLITKFTNIKYDEFSRIYKNATFDFTGVVQAGEGERSLQNLRPNSTVFILLPRHEKEDYYLDEKTKTTKPYPGQIILCNFDNTLEQGLYNGPTSLKPGDKVRVHAKLKTKGQGISRYPYVDSKLYYFSVDTLKIEKL